MPRRSISGPRRRFATDATVLFLFFVLLGGRAFGQDGPPPTTDLPAATLPGVDPEPVISDPPPGSGTVATVETGLAAEEGTASWYGRRFAGRRTACGRVFDPKQRTVAHPSLPCGTRVRVTNLSNGRSVEAEVTDRGPFTGGRIADLSRAVARELRFGGRGTVTIRLEVLDSAP